LCKVGKSALVLYFVQKHFTPEYDPTIEDMFRAQRNLDGEEVIFELYDTVPEVEYSTGNRAYWSFRAALCLFDITSRQTFEALPRVKEYYLKSADPHNNWGPDFNGAIVGTKLDREGERAVCLVRQHCG